MAIQCVCIYIHSYTRTHTQIMEKTVSAIECCRLSLSPPFQEQKEEEMTEEEKAAQKAKPVATNPIPGTPWYVHTHTATFTLSSGRQSKLMMMSAP